VHASVAAVKAFVFARSVTCGREELPDLLFYMLKCHGSLARARDGCEMAVSRTVRRQSVSSDCAGLPYSFI
jgi:hypothetical protein